MPGVGKELLTPPSPGLSHVPLWQGRIARRDALIAGVPEALVPVLVGLQSARLNAIDGRRGRADARETKPRATLPSMRPLSSAELSALDDRLRLAGATGDAARRPHQIRREDKTGLNTVNADDAFTVFYVPPLSPMDRWKTAHAYPPMAADPA